MIGLVAPLTPEPLHEQQSAYCRDIAEQGQYVWLPMYSQRLRGRLHQEPKSRDRDAGCKGGSDLLQEVLTPPHDYDNNGP